MMWKYALRDARKIRKNNMDTNFTYIEELEIWEIIFEKLNFQEALLT